MISEAEVKAKPDSELLEIWKNQSDYVAELVAWVKDELKSRGLEINTIRIITEDQKTDTSLRESAAKLIRFVSFYQLLSIIGLSFMALSLIHESPLFSVLLLALVTGFIVISVGVWIRKRWAFNVGVGIYAILATLNVAIVTLYLYNVLTGKQGIYLPTLILGIISIAYCWGAALSFNSLRKRPFE